MSWDKRVVSELRWYEGPSWKWHLWYRWRGYRRIERFEITNSGRVLKGTWHGDDATCYHSVAAEAELEREFEKPSFRGHRWSGWPGAWCLDCGTEDPYEVCIGICSVSDEEGMPTPWDCPIHGPLGRTECPTPKSDNYNPYVKEHE